MIKSLVIALALMTSGVLFSTFYVGYSRGGRSYISKQRHYRHSIRHGSGVYGSRGFRGGK